MVNLGERNGTNPIVFETHKIVRKFFFRSKPKITSRNENKKDKVNKDETKNN